VLVKAISIIIFLSVFSTAFSQKKDGCKNYIETYKSDSIIILDKLTTFDTLSTSKEGNVKLLKGDYPNDKMYLASYFSDAWHLWELKNEWFFGLQGELQIIRIAGVPKPLIYLKWKDSSRGSGQGQIYSGKMLWDIKGEKCYLDLIDKCTFYVHFKHVKNPRTEYDRYYCTAKISTEGIEMTFNNTCKNKFWNYESGEQLAYDMVGKYQTGFYTFNGEKWIIREK